MVVIPPKPPTKTTHTTPTPETYHQPPEQTQATTPHQPNHHAQTVVHYTPNTPFHPHSTEVDCTMSNHAGGFATIDPRHAGDTPQSSAYGSNSPQATNENKPHHHNKHTKTSRTRPTQPPKEHTTPALPSNHSGDFATIDHRHAGDTPQRSAYGSNSPQATNKDKPRHQRHTTSHHSKPKPPTKTQPRNRATTRRWNTARV